MQQQRTTWRWILGMLYVLAVALVWVAASFVVQSVVDAGVSPFLITYICNSLFLVYIPLVEIGGLLFQSILPTSSAPRLDGQSRIPAPPVDDSERNRLLQEVGDENNGAAAQHSVEGAEASVGESDRQGSQTRMHSADGAGHKLPPDEMVADGMANNLGSRHEQVYAVRGEMEDVEEEKQRLWSRKETAWISLQICPFWFLAQFSFNLSLKYTSVTSNTILSSASSLFTFLLSLKFLNEKFTWLKLWSVLLCMAGTIVVSLADSKEDKDEVATNPAWGDTLCLVSGIFYAVYTTLIRKKLPDETKGEGRASTALFLGFLGLWNALLFLPIAFILHFMNVESFHGLTRKQFILIVGKGFFDNVLSDYLWAKAVLLTTTTAATAGLSIQVPIAAVVDSIRGVKPHIFDIIGGIGVLIGFFGINQPATGCFGSTYEDIGNSDELPDDGEGKELVNLLEGQ